jgi:hypothetical protein
MRAFKYSWPSTIQDCASRLSALTGPAGHACTDMVHCRELCVFGALSLCDWVFLHCHVCRACAVAALSTQLSTAALDKHPQSKERGITLDLGFSSFLVRVHVLQLAGIRPTQTARPLVEVATNETHVKRLFWKGMLIESWVHSQWARPCTAAALCCNVLCGCMRHATCTAGSAAAPPVTPSVRPAAVHAGRLPWPRLAHPHCARRRTNH